MTPVDPHAAEIRLFLALLLVLSGGFYAFLFLEASAPARWLPFWKAGRKLARAPVASAPARVTY